MAQMFVGLLDGLATIGLTVGPPAALVWIIWGAIAALASGGARVIQEVVGRLLTAVLILGIILGAKTVILPELRGFMGV
jgi:hypothetical protein